MNNIAKSETPEVAWTNNCKDLDNVKKRKKEVSRLSIWTNN